MKSCTECQFAKELPFGEGKGIFCTRNPPTVEVVRMGDKVSLKAWYPPIAVTPCGEFKPRRKSA